MLEQQILGQDKASTPKSLRLGLFPIWGASRKARINSRLTCRASKPWAYASSICVSRVLASPETLNFKRKAPFVLRPQNNEQTKVLSVRKLSLAISAALAIAVLGLAPQVSFAQGNAANAQGVKVNLEVENSAQDNHALGKAPSVKALTTNPKAQALVIKSSQASLEKSVPQAEVLTQDASNKAHPTEQAQNVLAPHVKEQTKNSAESPNTEPPQNSLAPHAEEQAKNTLAPHNKEQTQYIEQVPNTTEEAQASQVARPLPKTQGPEVMKNKEESGSLGPKLVRGEAETQVLVKPEVLAKPEVLSHKEREVKPSKPQVSAQGPKIPAFTYEVALNELNRLVLPFKDADISTISTAEIKNEGEVIYVLPHNTKPITLFVGPANNPLVALKLTLLPQKIDAQAITLPYVKALASENPGYEKANADYVKGSVNHEAANATTDQTRLPKTRNLEAPKTKTIVKGKEIEPWSFNYGTYSDGTTHAASVPTRPQILKNELMDLWEILTLSRVAPLLQENIYAYKWRAAPSWSKAPIQASNLNNTSNINKDSPLALDQTPGLNHNLKTAPIKTENLTARVLNEDLSFIKAVFKELNESKAQEQVKKEFLSLGADFESEAIDHDVDPKARFFQDVEANKNLETRQAQGRLCVMEPYMESGLQVMSARSSEREALVEETRVSLDYRDSRSNDLGSNGLDSNYLHKRGLDASDLSYNSAFSYGPKGDFKTSELFKVLGSLSRHGLVFTLVYAINPYPKTMIPRCYHENLMALSLLNSRSLPPKTSKFFFMVSLQTSNQE